MRMELHLDRGCRFTALVVNGMDRQSSSAVVVAAVMVGRRCCGHSHDMWRRKEFVCV